MNIIFEYENKKLVLPVNPESVKVTKPSQSQKVEVIGIGEVSVPQKRKLASITISSFFWKDLFDQSFLLSGLGAVSGYLPSSISSGLENQVQGGINKVGNVVNQLPKASTVKNITGGLTDDSQKFKLLNDYVKWLEDWQASKKPARWTIVVPPNEPPQCFDFNVTCENFEYEIKAGEDTDYYYSIELLEWRHYGAKLLTPEKQANGKIKFKEEPDVRLEVKAALAPTEITGTEKDSLWSISKKYCNDNWESITKESVNKVAVMNSPNSLNRMVLKVPKQYISGLI